MSTQPATKRRVFLSYGHDRYTPFVAQLKQQLQDNGHEVWFDADKLKAGADWERYIEDGLAWAAEPGRQGCLVLLMTPHSVRRPDGYCLNELARANSKKIPVIPVMLAACEPPLSVARIQRLDMKGCAEELPTKPFESAFARLLDALEHNNLDYQGSESTLLRFLSPPDFSADIRDRLKDFVGREWVFERLRNWLDEPNGSRLFWITGNPGVGKSALAAQIAERFPEVAAFHACVHGNTDKADPRRVVMSVAYQLATQFPEYMERLVSLDLARISAESNAQTMFDNLLVQPLAGIQHPRRTFLTIIDALDEATQMGENDMARFIAKEFTRAPEWLRLIVTSRPEKPVTLPLQALKPYVLDTRTEANLDDIRIYLHTQLQSFSTSIISSKTIEAILAKSEGVFLYAVYVIGELRLGRLSLKTVDSFPQGLGGIYWDFFQRQFRELGNERWRDAYEQRFLPVLELLVASLAGGLPVDYICGALNWTVREQTSVLSALGSLFPVQGKMVRPFHSSILDWLQDPEQAGYAFIVDAKVGHCRHAAWGILCQRERKLTAQPYSVAHLPDHIVRAGMENWQTSLRTVLLDFDWMQAKLYQSGTNPLLNDYQKLLVDESCRTVARVVRQAAHILNFAPEMLPQQLFARVTELHLEAIRNILVTARARCSEHCLLPMAASLAQPSYMVSLLRGHLGSVTYVALAVDGRTVVSASYDHTLRVWDLITGEERHVLSGHKGEVASVALTANGHTAVSASYDHSLRVWDLITGEERRILYGHKDKVTYVTLTADGLTAVSTSHDHTLRVWDLNTGTERQVLRGHESRVTYVALTKDERTAVSASWDNTLRIWDLTTGKERQILRGHQNKVYHVALTANGRTAVSASGDNTLRIWDLATGKERQVLRGHQNMVFHVTITADGKSAVSASGDSTLRVWDLSIGKERQVLRGSHNKVYHVALTANGRIAVSFGGDNAVRIWDLVSGKELQVLRGHELRIHHVALSADGNTAVSASSDMTLRVWNLTAAIEHRAFPKRVIRRIPAPFTVSQRITVSTLWDYVVWAWYLVIGGKSLTLRKHASKVTHVMINTDGQTALSTSSDGRLWVWDVGTGGGRPMKCEIHTECVAFSADGHTAAWVSPAGFLEVRNVFTGKVVKNIRRDPYQIFLRKSGILRILSVALSPDGRIAVCTSNDHALRVWDLVNGKRLHVLKGHQKKVLHVAVSANGCTAVSASWDNTLREWDLATGKERQLIHKFDGVAHHVALSADGHTAVSAELNNTIRVWDLNSGKECQVIRGHKAKVTYVAISPDGQTAVSSSRDASVRVWNLGTGRCIGTFFGDTSFYACNMSPLASIVIAGDATGNVHLLRRASDPWFDGYLSTIASLYSEKPVSLSQLWRTFAKQFHLPRRDARSRS